MLRQRPIDNFIVDFYCAALGLVIEIDGDSHFTEEGKVYDAERTSVLEGYGLRVVRFTNVEVFQEFEGVCWRLEGLVGELSDPPQPPLRRGGPEFMGILGRAIALFYWYRHRPKRN